MREDTSSLAINVLRERNGTGGIAALNRLVRWGVNEPAVMAEYEDPLELSEISESGRSCSDEEGFRRSIRFGLRWDGWEEDWRATEGELYPEAAFRALSRAWASWRETSPKPMEGNPEDGGDVEEGSGGGTGGDLTK